MAHYSRSIIFMLSAVLMGSAGDMYGKSGEVAAAAEIVDSFGICKLLTNEQVDAVLAGHGGGEVVRAGGSMMEGVDSYQCSYTSEANGQYGVLTLVVSVASTPELLGRIRPSGFLYGEADRSEIADGAFINDKMDGELGVTVIKGLNKIDMELMAENAHDRRQQMIELATIVAAKL